jgi:dihydrofolate reductase
MKGDERPRPASSVSLIAAVASNRVIGRRGAIPWRIPGDLPRFKRLTMGHPVIMGHATFVSLGKPLPGRINIVLSRDPALAIPGCTVVHSRDEALRAAERGAPGEAFVIGGASVYALFLPVAARLYITWVDADVTGDTWFPEVSWNEWQVQDETAGKPAAIGQDVLPHRFVDYVRRDP